MSTKIEKRKTNFSTAQLNGIFPTPVMWNDLGREITKTEWEMVRDCKRDLNPNTGNNTSNNKYVLQDSRLSDLKAFIDSNLQHYFNEILSPKYDIKPYVTQSWINYTEPGEYHHKHAHPGSFVSGVFYIQSDNIEDKIHFYKDSYETLPIPTEKFNLYNSASWWFNTRQCSVVLFPSNLTHMVETTTSKKTRISLSFNTFIEGLIGEESSLTALHTERGTKYKGWLEV